MVAVPQISLNDGHAIPQLGFGVWQISDEDVTQAVLTAIDAGYRSIDTAQGYDNEDGVGRAVARSPAPRNELFITSKLRTRDQGYDATIRSFDGSLKRLGLDYLDLFLIHWPVPKHDRYSDTWKALVQLQRDGRVRSIGVSNFLPEHLERIIDDHGVAPAVNQIELHPRFQQRAARDIHARHDIHIESYSPLGGGRSGLREDTSIAAIARKHNKSPAQVMLRWHIQEGLIAIPKSANADRIRDNIAIFDFALDADDMAAFASLDRPDGKTLSDPATNNSLW